MQVGLDLNWQFWKKKDGEQVKNRKINVNNVPHRSALATKATELPFKGQLKWKSLQKISKTLESLNCFALGPWLWELRVEKQTLLLLCGCLCPLNASLPSSLVQPPSTNTFLHFSQLSQGHKKKHKLARGGDSGEDGKFHGQGRCLAMQCLGPVPSSTTNWPFAAR